MAGLIRPISSVWPGKDDVNPPISTTRLRTTGPNAPNPNRTALKQE